MATLTFDQISAVPRRSAVRKPARQAPPIAVVELAAPPADTGKRRTPVASIALVAAIIGLHGFAIYTLSQSKAVVVPAPAPKPITISLAPPKVEPPPPPPPPKLEPPAPRLKTPLPARAPATPVVAKDVPMVEASADTVQVAQMPVEAAPAPKPAPAPVAEPVTEPKGYAGYLRNPAPDYPLAAQKRGLEGKVVLKVHVLASGQPDSVNVATSSGHQILDEAAIKAVQQWAFAPARRGQTPIEGWVQVPLNFKI
ncbi:energy transducer TonB [Massilia sp. CF038]|uniref:energy transducer TonB n=1 Tax=Massilia sp. CF038 TaxID=1881045 RepID=UPI000923A94E|nr:energy transducer TonB [Massilia sp. CF038]SHH08365.1 outer membrane transport energization protein TonB [Massilia sp. CF038]